LSPAAEESRSGQGEEGEGQAGGGEELAGSGEGRGQGQLLRGAAGEVWRQTAEQRTHKRQLLEVQPLGVIEAPEGKIISVRAARVEDEEVGIAQLRCGSRTAVAAEGQTGGRVEDGPAALQPDLADDVPGHVPRVAQPELARLKSRAARQQREQPGLRAAVLP